MAQGGASDSSFRDILNIHDVPTAVDAFLHRVRLMNIGGAQSNALKSSLYDHHITQLLDRMFGELDAGATGPTSCWLDAVSGCRMDAYADADPEVLKTFSDAELRACNAASSIHTLLEIKDRTGAPPVPRSLFAAMPSPSVYTPSASSSSSAASASGPHSSLFVDVNPSALTFLLRRELLPPTTRSILEATAGTSPSPAFMPGGPGGYSYQRELFIRSDPLLWILQRNADRISGPGVPMLPPMSSKLQQQQLAQAKAGPGGKKKAPQQPQFPNSWPDGIFIALNDLLLCYFVHFAGSHTRRHVDRPQYPRIGGLAALAHQHPHVAAAAAAGASMLDAMLQHHHYTSAAGVTSLSDLYATVDDAHGLPVGTSDALAHQILSNLYSDSCYLDLLFRWTDTILGVHKPLEHPLAPVFIAAINAYWLLHNPPSLVPLPGEEPQNQLVPNPLGLFLGLPAEAPVVAKVVQSQQQQLAQQASAAIGYGAAGGAGSALSASGSGGAGGMGSPTSAALAFSASLIAPVASVPAVSSYRSRYGPGGVPPAESEHLFGAHATSSLSALSSTASGGASATASAAASATGVANKPGALSPGPAGTTLHGSAASAAATGAAAASTSFGNVVAPPYQPPTNLQLHCLAMLVTVQLCDRSTVDWMSGKEPWPQGGPKMAQVAKSTLVKIMAAQQTAAALSLPPQQQLAALSNASATGGQNPALFLVRKSASASASTSSSASASSAFNKAGIAYLQSLLGVPDSAVHDFYQQQHQTTRAASQQQQQQQQGSYYNNQQQQGSVCNYSYQQLNYVAPAHVGPVPGAAPPTALAALPGPSLFPPVLYELQHGLFAFLRTHMERCNPLMTPGLWCSIADIWIMVMTPWRARDRHKGESATIGTPLLNARSFDYQAAALKAARELSAAASAASPSSSSGSSDAAVVDADRVAEMVRKSTDFALALASTHDFEKPKRLVHAGGEPDSTYSFEPWRPWVAMNYAFYTYLLKVFLSQLAKAAAASSLPAAAAGSSSSAQASAYSSAAADPSAPSSNIFSFPHPNRILDCLERVLDVYEPCVVEELRSTAAVVETIFPAASSASSSSTSSAAATMGATTTMSRSANPAAAAAAHQQQQHALQQEQHQRSLQQLRETSGPKNDATRVRLLCHLGALKLTPQAMQTGVRRILASIDDDDVRAALNSVCSRLKAARDSHPVKAPYPSQELSKLIRRPASLSPWWQQHQAKAQHHQLHHQHGSGPLVRDPRSDSSSSSSALTSFGSFASGSPPPYYGPQKWLPSVDRLQFACDRLAIAFAPPVQGLKVAAPVVVAQGSGNPASPTRAAAAAAVDAAAAVVDTAKHALGSLFSGSGLHSSGSTSGTPGSGPIDCSGSATRVLWAITASTTAAATSRPSASVAAAPVALTLPTQLALLVSEPTAREQQQMEENQRREALRKRRAAESGGLRGCLRAWVSGEQWARFGARVVLWCIHASTGYSLRPLPPPKDPFAPETDADIRLRSIRSLSSGAGLSAADDIVDESLSADNRLLEALSPGTKRQLSMCLLTRRGKIELLEAKSRMTPLSIRFDEPDSLRPAGTHENERLLRLTASMNAALLSLLTRLTGINFGRSAAEIKELMMLLSSSSAEDNDGGVSATSAAAGGLGSTMPLPSRGGGSAGMASMTPRTPATPAAIRREMDIASARRTPAALGLGFVDGADRGPQQHQPFASPEQRELAAVMASTRMGGKSVLRDTYVRALQEPPNYLRPLADTRVFTLAVVLAVLVDAWCFGLFTPRFFLAPVVLLNCLLALGALSRCLGRRRV